MQGAVCHTTVVKLDARLSQYGIQRVDQDRLPAPAWLDLSDTYRERTPDDPKEAAINPHTGLGALYETLGERLQHFSGGQEQAVFIDPDNPALLIKVPYDMSLSVGNGICSVLVSALAARYRDSGSGAYADAVPASLYWHASGYPLLIQERCWDAYGWKRRLPMPLVPVFQLYRQVGQTQSGHWGVYDYDGMSPFGYELEDEALDEQWCAALAHL
jgi:hypothetical protein